MAFILSNAKGIFSESHYMVQPYKILFVVIILKNNHFEAITIGIFLIIIVEEQVCACVLGTGH